MTDSEFASRVEAKCKDHEIASMDDECRNTLVQILKRYRISIAEGPETSRNDRFVNALKTFQTRNTDADGNPLEVTGRIDPATVDALVMNKKRQRFHLLNFVLAAFVALVFMLWNDSYWLQEHQNYKNILVAATLGVGALYSVLLQTTPDSPFHLRSLVYRMQGHSAFTGVLIAMLVLCTYLLLYKDREPQQRVSQKKTLLHLAIVGSDVPYSNLIEQGFIQKVESMLEPSNYLAHIETTKVTTFGATATPANLKNVFDEVLSRFAGAQIDCLVTIGSQATAFAKQNYSPRLPIIFLGVTDPMKLGIVSHFAPDPKRGPIAGSTYPIDTDSRMRFIADAFPNRKLGYIYNPVYPQDVIARDKIRESVARLGQNIEIVQIETAETALTPEQNQLADIFFGYAHLNAHFAELSASSSKPFIGISLTDGYRNAVAAVAGDDRELGEKSAEKIFIEHILKGRALSDIGIYQMPADSMLTLINKKIARRKNLTIGPAALQNAKIVLEEN